MREPIHIPGLWTTIVLGVTMAACGPAAPPSADTAPGDSAASSNSGEASDVVLETYVDRGVCPFECCTYTEWTARDSLRVYAAEGDSSTVAFTLAPGERFTGITGNVHLDPPGLVVARDTVLLNQEMAGGPVVLMPGDTVQVLSPIGEGFFNLLHEGRVVEGAGFWGFNAMENLEAQGELLREPEWEWWAQVRNAEGETGWLNMSTVPGQIGGVDACGGPE